MAQNWFEAHAPKADSAPQAGGNWFTQHAPKAPAAAVPDLDTHTGEGIYWMSDKSGKQKGIPYSNVRKAVQQGLTFRPDSKDKLTRDITADPDAVTKFFPELNLANRVMATGKDAQGKPIFTSSAPETDVTGGIRITGINDAGQPIFGPTPHSGPKGSATQRLGAGFIEPIVGTVKGVYDALSKGPQNETEVGLQAGGGPFVGPLALRVKRLLLDPTLAEWQKAAELDKLMAANPKERNWLNRYLTMEHLMGTVPLVGPAVAGIIDKYAEQGEKGDIAGMLGGWGGNVALAEAPKLAGEGLSRLPEMKSAARGKLAQHYAPKYAPGSVPIAGVDVPIGAGEEAPFTPEGRDFIRLKRKGVGARAFERFEQGQQRAVKEVIRRTAQQTSGLIGPMPKEWYTGEPAAAMRDAAEITFDRAKPMYRALDTAAVNVPDTFANASKITQTAIERARKLGVEIDTEPHWVDARDEPVDPSQLPLTQAEIDARVKAGQLRPTPAERAARKTAGQPVGGPLSQAEIDARQAAGQLKLTPAEIEARKSAGDLSYVSPASHPLTTYMRVRSQLLKMQRLSKDPAVSFQISQEVRVLNDAMDKVLATDPPLYENWKEASRLWAKGVALRTVAREIGMITKGTPTEVQMEALRRHLAAGEVAIMPEPTRLQGASLVNRLNKLTENGVLEKAFTPEEVANLRESANLLERIQKTHVGRTAERTHGLGHVLGLGAKGSAALGAVAGGLHGGVPGAMVGALGGAGATGLLGWLQELREDALAEVMTTKDGVQALRAVQAAKTPGQLDVAVKRVKALTLAATAASAAQQVPKKNPRELNTEAARIAGATAAAMPGQPPPAATAPSKPAAAKPVLSLAINRAATASGVNSNLIRAVIGQESGGKTGAVSIKGATGVMQLMPSTAEKYGVTDATDPTQNVTAGARYLRDLLDKHHGDTAEALKDYYGRGTPPPGYPSADEYAQAVLGRFKSLSAPQSQTAAQPKKTPLSIKEAQAAAKRLQPAGSQAPVTRDAAQTSAGAQ